MKTLESPGKTGTVGRYENMSFLFLAASNLANVHSFTCQCDDLLLRISPIRRSLTGFKAYMYL